MLKSMLTCKSFRASQAVKPPTGVASCHESGKQSTQFVCGFLRLSASLICSCGDPQVAIHASCFADPKMNILAINLLADTISACAFEAAAACWQCNVHALLSLLC